MHHAKFDLAMTQKYLQEDMQGNFHDTLTMSWLLMNLHPHHRLKDLLWELCGYPMDDEAAVKGYGGYQFAPEEKLSTYAANDAERAAILFLTLWPDIEGHAGVLDAYEVEKKLIPITQRIESRGLVLDRERTKQMIIHLERDRKRLKDLAQRYANYSFDVASPDQVRYVLFKVLGLPTLEVTAKGKDSTRKNVLLALRENHKIIDVVLKYRSYSKGVSTLIGYLEAADSDGVVRPDIMTTGTRTGREACSNPNLFNVAKPDVLKNPFPINARSLFVAKEGYYNYSFDYDAQEFHLAAHYHKDPEILRIIRSGGDPHYAAGEMFYGKDRMLRDVKSKRRNAAKNTNFAFLYGGGLDAIAKTLNLLDREKVKTALERYDDKFSRVRPWTRELIAEAKGRGFVTTEFGRRLRVNPAKSFEAVNYLIQANGADIIKRKQVNIDALAEIVLPVYDDITLQIPRSLSKRQRREVLTEIKREMEDLPMFDVPLTVGCARWTRWSEKKKLDLVT
jgi:DNA polymerase-1